MMAGFFADRSGQPTVKLRTHPARTADTNGQRAEMPDQYTATVRTISEICRRLDCPAFLRALENRTDQSPLRKT